MTISEFFTQLPQKLITTVYLKYSNKNNFFNYDVFKVNNNQVLVLYDGQNIKGNKNNLDSFSFSKSDFNLSILETNTTTYKN